MRQSSARRRRRAPLPESFETLDDLWEFWDTHSSADYEDLMEDVDVAVDIRSSKVYCAVAKDIAREVRAQARRQGLSAETLVNVWLREKIAAAGRPRT